MVRVIGSLNLNGGQHVPASGMVSNADTALRADLFNSSCFSNSCLTELALTFSVHVYFNGSTNLSRPALSYGDSETRLGATANNSDKKTAKKKIKRWSYAVIPRTEPTALISSPSDTSAF